jgi:membrane protease YdiL (CAAX protease family)
MLLVDSLVFGGVSLPRIRSTATLPLWMRAIIPVYAAVTEEAIYRLGAMTLVVWLATLAGRRSPEPASAPIVWLGIGISAVLFGLAHVANVPDAPHPIVRAVVLNGFAGTVLGWLYWRRGFEAAVVAHFGADVFIYLVIASVR